jgi:hypothetical protein
VKRKRKKSDKDEKRNGCMLDRDAPPLEPDGALTWAVVVAAG